MLACSVNCQDVQDRKSIIQLCIEQTPTKSNTKLSLQGLKFAQNHQDKSAGNHLSHPFSFALSQLGLQHETISHNGLYILQLQDITRVIFAINIWMSFLKMIFAYFCYPEVPCLPSKNAVPMRFCSGSMLSQAHLLSGFIPKSFTGAGVLQSTPCAG